MNRSDDMACLVGRLFIAALLLPAGLQKLMHFSKFAASVASKGLPFPKLWAMLDVARRSSGLSLSSSACGRVGRRWYWWS